MGDKVELKVASDFRKIIADLEGLQKRAAGVADQIKRVGDDLDKNLQRNSKKTEQHFERMRDLGRRVADQLRGYFADIASQMVKSLEFVKRDLGLKQQFIDATKGAIDLHDAIRKIGGSLGIANDRLGEFQKSINAAFSGAGFGTNEAVRALQGLAGTRVEGEQNVQDYALTATKLAQAGGESGQEGEIAKMLAEVLRTRGIDQNNTDEMRRLANSVRGRNPLEKLQGQQAMYSAMEPSLRGQYGPETMRGLAAVRKEVGPEMDAFITKMMQGWLQKLPQSAQGLGKIVGPNGIDFDELKKNAPLLKRLGNDTVASGATLGLSADEARGLYALWKHADRANAAQRNAGAGGSIDEQVASTRGIGENMAAVKNQVTGAIGGVLAKPIGVANDIIGGASKTTAGSAALMAGTFAAATGASMLLSKFGGGKIGGVAQTGARMAALEQITGQKTQPVYVVNFSELQGVFGGAGVGGPGVVGGGGAMGAAGALAGAASIGLVIGTGIVEALNRWTPGKSAKTGVEGDWLTRSISEAMQSLSDATGGKLGTDYKAVQKALEENTRVLEQRRQEAKAAASAAAEAKRRARLDAKASAGRTGAAVATPNIGGK